MAPGVVLKWKGGNSGAQACFLGQRLARHGQEKAADLKSRSLLIIGP
jgi:hypothetical protein